jgi:indolepyruvate ferredoxin oxidoreductase
MNAPLTDATRHSLATVTLDDKYTLAQGRAFMNGVQALVRLPMLQRARDAARGLDTAGFVSGYRGSPLAGYDVALWQAKAHLAAANIVFQPGVNEELAATAVWGTQQLDLFPAGRKHDGVFGIWYGKGPGVDRCSDVFKHANMAGTARHGGVIAVAGDDHAAKSSTAAHQSDHIFKACGMPVFFPASVQEILDLGLHAFALSRYAGVWAAMKTIQEVVESAASVDIGAERVQCVLPDDFVMPQGGLHIRWPDAALEQEARLMEHKWYAALAYVRANRLNRDVLAAPDDRFGLIASGKAFADTCQALADLGLDVAACRRLGIRLHKVAVVWPLEATSTRAFARGLQEILVVEEKRQVIEYQLKEELYNWRGDVRPRVLGKFDAGAGDDSGGEWSRPNPGDHWLLRANADLTPAIVARAIARRLFALGVPEDLAARMRKRLDVIADREASLAVPPAAVFPGAHAVPAGIPPAPAATSSAGAAARQPATPESPPEARPAGDAPRAVDVPPVHVAPVARAADVPAAGPSPPAPERQPWFCSGCPHNTSTKVPEGSRAVAGIGCHYMALWMQRSTVTFSQMGGEGVSWVGQAPFSNERHVFANIGDGTYFHSGILAIRQAVAAGVAITYKLLFNDAVAMTGGQPVDGSLGVPQITHELAAEGVRRIAVVSDEPEKYDALRHALAPGVTVHHRDALDDVQRVFRTLPGCTVIVYDQACATEKRRRRKRGLLATPARSVLVNPLVCEGCGDCSLQSNCLSVEPLETPFGTKRTINQDSCNKDFSCLAGFCPSFVTVEGGTRRAPAARTAGLRPPALPEPVLPAATRAWGIVIAGVGGTGVITIGQLLGMAAHLEGKGVVTQDAAGLAQKGGATWSHVQVADTAAGIFTTKVGTAKAMLVLGCDPIVTADGATLALMREGRTTVVLNTHGAPTAAFVGDAAWRFPGARCDVAIERAAGAGRVRRLDAEAVAVELLGDAIYANPVLLGCAWQLGTVPLHRESILRAIELNGVQVADNQAAFEWGRACAHDPDAVQALFGARRVRVVDAPSLDALVEARAGFLAAYQDDAYAQRYRADVDRVRGAEAAAVAGSTRLAEAAADGLFRLMAAKDEYEVARLHLDAGFAAQVAAQFDGDYRIVHHLAPPLLARRDAHGVPRKRAFGPWVRTAFAALVRLRRLRGTWLDPFGHTQERRSERALLAEYRGDLDAVCQGLAAVPRARADACLDIAVRMARIPGEIRGFGHVRARHLAAVRPRWTALRMAWRAAIDGDARPPGA